MGSQTQRSKSSHAGAALTTANHKAKRWLSLLGRNGSARSPCSVVIDHVGIYYDAIKSSYLEQLVKRPYTDAELERAHELIQAWRIASISKYNHAPEEQTYLNNIGVGPDYGKPYILVVDQVVPVEA